MAEAKIPIKIRYEEWKKFGLIITIDLVGRVKVQNPNEVAINIAYVKNLVKRDIKGYRALINEDNPSQVIDFPKKKYFCLALQRKYKRAKRTVACLLKVIRTAREAGIAP